MSSSTQTVSNSLYDMTITLTVERVIGDIAVWANVTVVSTPKTTSTMSYTYNFYVSGKYHTGGQFKDTAVGKSTSHSQSYYVYGGTGSGNMPIEFNTSVGLGYSTTLPYEGIGIGMLKSASDTVVGGNTNATITTEAGQFYYKLLVKNGDTTYNETDYEYYDQASENFQMSVANTAESLKNLFPNSATVSMNLVLNTYNSSKSLLGASTKQYTLTLPDNDANKPSVSASVSGKDSDFNVFLEGYSTPQFSVALTPKYGATIATAFLEYGDVIYELSVDKSLTSSQTITKSTAVIASNSDEWKNYKITVTDSRGFQKVYNGTIDVVGYTKPRFYNESVKSFGTTAYITADYSWTNIAGNSASYKITRKRAQDTTETVVVGTTALTQATGSIALTETVEDISVYTYEYYLYITDVKQTIIYSRKTGINTLSLKGGGDGAAFFQQAEEGDNTLKVNGKIKVDQILIKNANDEYIDIQDTLDDTAEEIQELVDTAINKEWVLKNSISGTSSDRGNIVSGCTVNLTGCTELSIFARVSSSGTAYLTGNSNITLGCVGASDSRTSYGRWVNSAVGIECIDVKYGSSKTTNTLNITGIGCTTICEERISDITSITLSAPDKVSSCEIYIYAK